MVQITNLTDAADQTTSVILADGSALEINLNFRPTTKRWTMDFSYGTFIKKAMGLSVHPNLLRRYRNIIPFGIAIVSTDQCDPFKIDDFASGRAKLFILDNTLVTGPGSDLDLVEQEFFSVS